MQARQTEKTGAHLSSDHSGPTLDGSHRLRSWSPPPGGSGGSGPTGCGHGVCLLAALGACTRLAQLLGAPAPLRLWPRLHSRHVPPPLPPQALPPCSRALTLIPGFLGNQDSLPASGPLPSSASLELTRHCSRVRGLGRGPLWGPVFSYHEGEGTGRCE